MTTPKNRLMAITDIETTGLFPPEGEIIEMGLLLVDQTTLDVITEWEAKVLPEHPESAKESALKWNTYNEEQWADEAVSLEEAMRAYAHITQGASLWAWNKDMELRFLRPAFQVAGFESIDDVMDYHHKDIADMASEILRFTDFKGERLKDTCIYLGVEPEPMPHEALEGARKEFEVYHSLRMIEEVRLRGMDDLIAVIKEYNSSK